MKNKALHIALVCEAALCLALCLGRTFWPGMFTAAAAFPFEQVGLGLRALSLSGAAGNSIAIALYVLLCLLPLGALGLIRRKRALRREDWLLVALTVVLFPVLYYMINPQLIAVPESRTGKAVLGMTVYSVFVGYGVLRVLRLFFSGATQKLYAWLAWCLRALAVLFVWSMVQGGLGSFMDAREALRAGNTGYTGGLWLTELFLALEAICRWAVPYGLGLWVAFRALELLAALEEDPYSETALALVEGLSRLCRLALEIEVLTLIGFNVLQMIALPGLLSVNAVVSIPVTAMAFVLGVLLLARYIGRNKALKDDNDLFI